MNTNQSRTCGATNPTFVSDLSYALTTCRQFVTFEGAFAPWSDATTPRTDRPVRFVAHPARPHWAAMRPHVSGLSSHIVRLPS